MSEKRYEYVGSAELRERCLAFPADRFHPTTGDEMREWLRHQLSDVEDEQTFTFVVDAHGHLILADRHSEHVAAARGLAVLSAGEITIALTGDAARVVAVTNQSTGFCPEPCSWPVVSRALADIGITKPEGFTTEFEFRRCPACAQINIVKDSFFQCAVCDESLPEDWNLSEGSSNGPVD